MHATARSIITGAERASYRLEHHIASQMAVGVIHPFEVVDVQHQQQGCLAGACDAIDFTFQHGAEMSAVRQSRERVFERQLAQAVDQTLQIKGRHLAVQCCLAAAGLSHQCVGSIQAKVAQIYQMRGR